MTKWIFAVGLFVSFQAAATTVVELEKTTCLGDSSCGKYCIKMDDKVVKCFPVSRAENEDETLKAQLKEDADRLQTFLNLHKVSPAIVQRVMGNHKTMKASYQFFASENSPKQTCLRADTIYKAELASFTKLATDLKCKNNEKAPPADFPENRATKKVAVSSTDADCVDNKGTCTNYCINMEKDRGMKPLKCFLVNTTSTAFGNSDQRPAEIYKNKLAALISVQYLDFATAEAELAPMKTLEEAFNTLDKKTNYSTCETGHFIVTKARERFEKTNALFECDKKQIQAPQGVQVR